MSFVDVTEHRRFAPEKMQKLNLFESAHMFCDVYCLEPGQAQKPHDHPDATKFYYVLEGSGEIRIGDQTHTVSPGQLAFAMPGEIHGVTNTSTNRLVLLVAMSPNPNPNPNANPNIKA